VPGMTYGRFVSTPTYKRARTRPRPWPFDASLDKVGLILGATGKSGGPNLQANKPADQAGVAPTDYGENAQNPVFGRTWTWRTLHLGMGTGIDDQEPPGPSGRYQWAINANCSVQNRLCTPGPLLHTVTVPPPTAPSPLPPADLTDRDAGRGEGCRSVFELKGNLYWTHGRDIYRLDSPATSTPVATKVATGANTDQFSDACLFTYNTGVAGDEVYLGSYTDLTWTVPGPLYRFDGTTLTAHGTLKATCVVKLGRNLYRAGGAGVNTVSSVDVNTDPWVDTNWRADNQFYAGDLNSPITRLDITPSGALLVFKTDGVYSYDAQGEEIPYFPQFRQGPSRADGSMVGQFMNDLYVRYADSLYRLTPDMSIRFIGPSRFGTVTGPVTGRVTGFVGHGSYYAFATFENPDSGNTYLCQFGAVASVAFGTQGQQPDPQTDRVECWHGSLSPPIPKRVTQLYRSAVGAPNGHRRIYLAYDDGTVGYFTAPCVADPLLCDETEFSLDPSYVVLPDWHGGFRKDKKPLRYATVAGEQLDGQNYAILNYRVDPVNRPQLSTQWTALSGHFDTVPSERIEFPEGTTAVTLGLRIDLANGQPPNVPPVVDAVSLRWRLATELQQVYTLIVLASDGLICRDGTPLRRGAKRIREHVRALAESAEIVEFVSADEEVKQVSIFDYGETIAWWERAEKWVSALKVSVAEDATGAIYGTYGRLRAYTYGGLRGMTYGDLRRL